MLLIYAGQAIELAENIEELDGYDCSVAETGEIISLRTHHNCIKQTKNITTSSTYVQLISILDAENQEIFYCKIDILVIAMRCGGFFEGRNVIQQSYTTTIELSREQCEKMHRTQTYVDPIYPQFVIYLRDGFGQAQQEIIGSTKKGICNPGPIWVNHYGMQFEDMVVSFDVKVNIGNYLGTVHYKEDELILPHGVQCKYSDKNCKSSFTGNNFWNINQDFACDDKRLLPFFQGIVTKITEYIGENDEKTVYLLTDPEADRQFLIEKHGEGSLCGNKCVLTQTREIRLIESDNGVFFLKTRKNITSPSLDINLYHSMKLSMIYHDVFTQVKQMYEELSYIQCLSNVKTISNMLTTAHIDPRGFYYSIHAKPGKYGLGLGEAVLIMNCIRKTVRVRKTINDCHADLPIVYEGEEKFLTPRSRLIVDNSKIVECEIGTMFLINDVWHRQTATSFKIIDKVEELEIELKRNFEFKMISALVDKGIWSSQETAAWKKSISSNMGRNSQGTNIMRALIYQEKKRELEQETPFWKLDLQQMLKAFFNPILETMEKFGIYCAMILGIYIIISIIKSLIKLINEELNINTAFSCVANSFIFCCKGIKQDTQTENPTEGKKKKAQKLIFNKQSNEIAEMDLDPEALHTELKRIGNNKLQIQGREATV